MRTTTSERRVILLLMSLLFALVTVQPAAADSQCLTDAADDVIAIEGATPVDAPEVDILAMCVVNDGTTLEVAIRTARFVDPSDSIWDDAAMSVSAAIETGANPDAYEFNLNLLRWDADTFEWRLFPNVAEADAVCSGPPIFDNATRYRMRVPLSCLDSPPDVRVAGFIRGQSSFEDQENAGIFDDLPSVDDDPPFAGPFSGAPEPDTAVTRLFGGGRIDTAIAISQDQYGDDEAAAVVLATQSNFPDALAGGPLAAAAGGPLLLTPTDSTELAPQLIMEIQRVLPEGRTIYLLGGPVAISATVEEEMTSLGYAVERLAGAGRSETALLTARQAIELTGEDPDVIVLADQNNDQFPFALIGGALASDEGGVQVLSNRELAANPEVQAFLDDYPDVEVVTVGNDASTSFPGRTAFASDDIFQTSVDVATARYAGPTAVALASGTNFPDGLAGGAHTAFRDAPLLLSWPDVLPQAVATYLAANAETIGDVYMYGGPVAMSDQIERDAAAAAL